MEERPRDDLEWLFVAQHYGIPTTLLDWTEDPACALYFALCSMRSAFEVDKGGLRGLSPTVWCLNPRRLNAITDARMQYENDAGVLLYETRAIIFPKEGNLKEWTDTVFGDDHPARRNAFPVAILPTHSTPRIVAQRGMFTLHGNWPEPIESLTELRYPFGGAPCGIRRISIRNSKRILREMRSLQISRFRFFPEIHVAAENARHEFEEALRRMTY
ncbi:MAG: FRG domain-containing protein [Myxococcales bacterium]|nr:FRG domain-containing protein [Myxococcales bacterium]